MKQIKKNCIIIVYKAINGLCVLADLNAIVVGFLPEFFSVRKYILKTKFSNTGKAR